MNTLTYMAFGAGTQSMAMLILAAQGKIPKPDIVLFADTKGEPAWVYEQADWAASFAFVHGMPFHKVERDEGIEEQVEAGVNGDRGHIDNPPFYSSSGNLMQKCTRHWKVRVMESWISKAREKGQPVIAQIGLSADEASRMKATGEKKYIQFSYPLIDLGMHRGDSIRLVEEVAGFTPKRSACRFCPWHSDAYWQMLKDDHPDEFEQAAAFEDKAQKLQGRCGIEGKPFLHASRKPLRDVDFVGWRDVPGQTLMFERDQFGNECGGYCGV